MAYRACSGFWVTNSRGAGADCFFDWELASGRGRVAGCVPFEPKGVGSFLLSWSEKKILNVNRCLIQQNWIYGSKQIWSTDQQTDWPLTSNPAHHPPSIKKCTHLPRVTENVFPSDLIPVKRRKTRQIKIQSVIKLNLSQKFQLIKPLQKHLPLQQEGRTFFPAGILVGVH